MAWGTPTITRTRGRRMQHTHITAIGTLSGTTFFLLDFNESDSFPQGVFAGSIMAGVTAAKNNEVITMTIKVNNQTINYVNPNLYRHALTIGAAATTGWFPIASVFEDLGNELTPSIGLGGVAYPSVEWRVSITSDDATSVAVVEMHMGLLSHNLEV